MPRYLVVVPPERSDDETQFADVEAHALAVGDRVVVGGEQLRVRVAVELPAEEEYDATLVCTPEEPEERASSGDVD